MDKQFIGTFQREMHKRGLNSLVSKEIQIIWGNFFLTWNNDEDFKKYLVLTVQVNRHEQC